MEYDVAGSDNNWSCFSTLTFMRKSDLKDKEPPALQVLFVITDVLPIELYFVTNT